MPMVSMKRDPKEAKEYGLAATAPGDMPLYSYGTKLCLNDDDLLKLGMPMPAVGQKFMLMAIVEVTMARAEKVQEGAAEIGADFQITDMELTPAAGKDPASVLWPDAE